MSNYAPDSGEVKAMAWRTAASLRWQLSQTHQDRLLVELLVFRMFVWKLWQQLQLWNISQNLDNLKKSVWTGFSFTIGPPISGTYLIGGTLDVLNRPLVCRSKTIGCRPFPMHPMNFHEEMSTRSGARFGPLLSISATWMKRQTFLDDGPMGWPFLRGWLFGLSVFGIFLRFQALRSQEHGRLTAQMLGLHRISEWNWLKTHTRSQWGRKTGLGSRSISKHWVMTDSGSGSWQCVAHPSEGGWLKCRMGLEARWQAREAPGSILEQASWPFKAQDVQKMWVHAGAARSNHVAM